MPSTPLFRYEISIADALRFLKEIVNTHNILPDSSLGQDMLRLSIQLQQIEPNITPRSRSASDSSTSTLGDRIAAYDKEHYLSTYRWVPRGGENGWAHGNDFKSWVQDTYKRLPQPDSELNCWEAVLVLLYLYHAITKQEIMTAYEAKADFTSDDEAVKE